MSVADWSGTQLAWAEELETVKARLGRLFRRSESRRAAFAYLDGLLAGVERKNGWILAEHAGYAGPWNIQAVLGRSRWDAAAARDLVRDYVVEQLGDQDGVLVVDETGFLKKGDKSAGVARQYSGTAGRIENCQIGVFLSYASRYGRALIDRRLYLPQAWTEALDRRREAGIPDDVSFASKPQLAREMIADALDAGVPCSWVLGDAVYGADKRLRVMLEEREQPYVLAVRSNEKLMTPRGTITAEAMADAVPEDAWERLSAGAGAKGLRLYDWTRVRLMRFQRSPWDHWLLVRRNRHDPTDLAYFVVFGPETATLADLAGVAGQRWTIEECFLQAKSEVGLDDYEVRNWHGWYRHITLAMLALAYLAALRAKHLAMAHGKANITSPQAAMA